MPSTCEASYVRLSRFLHFVFEMTKQCFVIVMPNACEASQNIIEFPRRFAFGELAFTRYN